MKEFRVWDKDRREYSLEEFYLDTSGGLHRFSDNSFDELIPAENFEPEFWTGLTDSEGVKIFDNDDFLWKSDGSKLSVYYNDEMGCWMARNLLGTSDGLLSFFAKNAVVIGTIHEDEK